MHIDYGHFKANTPLGDFDFYPSLENMVKIGTPEEIVNIANQVNMTEYHEWLSTANPNDQATIYQAFIQAKNKAVSAAHLIMLSCCKQDVTPLIGKVVMGPSKIHVQPGFITDYDEIIALARHLIKHGVIGKSDNEKVTKNAKPVTQFMAHEYVSMARRHLNMSRDEAWSMTMTELIMELDAINPKKEESPTGPTDDEYDEIMAIVNGGSN